MGDLAGNNELCVEALGPGGGTAGATPEPGVVAAMPDDPSSNWHGKLGLPNVAPDGDRIAISTFTDDFDTNRPVTTLRVYDLASGRATDVASGVETLVLDPNGAAHVTGILEGNPVWMGGIAWSADGRRLLYLSPEPATTRSGGRSARSMPRAAARRRPSWKGFVPSTSATPTKLEPGVDVAASGLIGVHELDHRGNRFVRGQ